MDPTQDTHTSVLITRILHAVGIDTTLDVIRNALHQLRSRPLGSDTGSALAPHEVYGKWRRQNNVNMEMDEEARKVLWQLGYKD